MVKQEGRGTLSRKGPFFIATPLSWKAIWLWQEAYVALGFPSERHNVVAQRLGFYYEDEVDHMVEVSWMPKPCRPQVWTELRKLDCDDAYSEEVTIGFGC